MRGSVGWAVVFALVAACGSTSHPPADSGRDGDVGLDAGPPCSEALDLLFVVDNSADMAAEQVWLAEHFGGFLRSLVTGEVRDPDTGEVVRTFAPTDDVHVGVVTTDMGSGGFDVPSCDDPEDGDDGILRTQNTTVAGCVESEPAFLSFTAGDDADGFAEDFSCIARVGTGGCGYEQPLEAALTAVTEHADRANAGFLRPGSLLGVVVLTKEDDCSASDPELFDPDSTSYEGGNELRCSQYPDALQPLERYVTGLTEVRPRRLMFYAITGVPPDLAPAQRTEEYDAILDDPRMVEERDPENPSRIESVCELEGGGLAFPGRRVVSLARRLEERNVGTGVDSICAPEPSLEPVYRAFGRLLSHDCE